MTGYNSPRDFVQVVMWTAQKARSTMMEQGTDVVGTDLFPGLWVDDWHNVLLVAERMLADGREPTGQDAVNLSYLVHRDEALANLLNVGVVVHGYDELPDPIECMKLWATVGVLP